MTNPSEAFTTTDEPVESGFIPAIFTLTYIEDMAWPTPPAANQQ